MNFQSNNTKMTRGVEQDQDRSRLKMSRGRIRATTLKMNKNLALPNRFNDSRLDIQRQSTTSGFSKEDVAPVRAASAMALFSDKVSISPQLVGPSFRISFKNDSRDTAKIN